MKSFVLFNNKVGVGTTTLTYHIAHMMSRRGSRVVVLDYDPQCHISAMFIEEERLFDIWQSHSAGGTVTDCIDLVRTGKGDVRSPNLLSVGDNLWLLPGHLSLSTFEQVLSSEWPNTIIANNGHERALDITLALDRLSNMAAAAVDADYLLLDVGPSLGAINRSALLGCDAVVIPTAPDLFCLEGLMNVGETLKEWRSQWQLACAHHLPGRDQAACPKHDFTPIGYLLQQHLSRADRPVTGYARWAAQIPSQYRRFMIGNEGENNVTLQSDPNCIAIIKYFSSLVPIAKIARKPIFDLKQADGVGGGQIQAVAECRRHFEAISTELVRRLMVG